MQSGYLRRLYKQLKKKRSEKQWRKGHIYPTKHRVPKNRWRDKKAFFNEQCIKLEGENRKGKTRALFRKTGDSKGTVHLNLGTIKDGNGRDLVDAEEIKKRGKEHIEELYKKDLHELHYVRKYFQHIL